MNTRRFLCPSSQLDLKRVLWKTRRTLWIGLGLALAVHILMTQLTGFREEAKVAKPLTTQFIKRAPRLTKPLELKKLPQPKRRRMRRTMVSVEAKVNRGGLSSRMHSVQVVQSLAKPRIAVGRSVSVDQMELEPEALAERVLGAKEAKAALDMSLELMSIEALDTGQYHAMVIQDPSDKRNIQGFLHIVHAYPKSIVNSVRADIAHLTIGCAALKGLIEAMNDYTQIKTDFGGRYTFDSKELMKIPFVLTSSGGFSFDHTVSEAASLGKYMLTGGFYMADCRHPALGPDRPSARSFRKFIIAGMEAEHIKFGRDWNWEKIPNDHPLYHCYFDFDNGPPPGVDNLSVVTFTPIDYLEGVIWDGRLMAILSLKAYTAVWEADKASSWGERNNSRQRQFGVNLIIFALTQEKSITKRAMDSMSY